MPADTLAVYDHLRPTDADGSHQPGIYRVVGTSEDDVTLLRVGDADGRRVHTGEIVTVPNDARSGFEPAENPDGNRSVGVALASLSENAYWSLRTFAGSLATHPFASAVALALLVTGWFGEGVLELSDAALSGLVLAGAFGLAYIGSGRL
ncbi:hypothetical protein [Halococcus agarilyticus]|uniref:hypothetical protein n=1 Tax=Halococcus agarilyticus TaxID=1232219 RepID=UPI000677CECE|nr:hypothetical protein [Halococcus agarilyticus]